MKSALPIVAVLFSLYFISCSPSREKMLTEISGMETRLKSEQKPDTNAVTELLSAYQNFAARFSKDSLAPEYLYKAAGMAVGFNRGTQAVDLYESIINGYPAYKKIPECYFMEAFAYENAIGNIAKASEYYNKFLAKYPEHDLADDAQAALKFLGKSPEEMVREFEAKNADSAVSASK